MASFEPALGLAAPQLCLQPHLTRSTDRVVSPRASPVVPGSVRGLQARTVDTALASQQRRLTFIQNMLLSACEQVQGDPRK